MTYNSGPGSALFVDDEVAIHWSRQRPQFFRYFNRTVISEALHPGASLKTQERVSNLPEQPIMKATKLLITGWRKRVIQTHYSYSRAAATSLLHTSDRYGLNQG